MKYLLVVFCVFFQSVLLAQNVSIDSTITWNPNEKLLWSDFKGEVNPDHFGKAKTSYKIEIVPENVRVDAQDRIQGYEKLTVVARFYKKHSWTTVAKNDTIVLDHEQLHFDIAELFARKIRKTFKELQKNKEARFSVYSNEYGVLWTECRKYQQQFDFETDHGREIQINKTWLEKVQTELNLLKEFK